MLILDKPRRFDGSTIKIPLYHRGHLSLFPEATVWLCLLPGLRAGQLLPEIVISPIHYESWHDLWRISVTLNERVGLVHDIFAVLAEHHINVVAVESSSMERQRLHSIEIIMDAKLYSGSLSDGTREDRASGKVEDLSELRRAILARVLHDVAFLPSRQERLRIRRVRNLFEAVHDFNEAQKEVRRGGFRPVVRETKVIKSGREVLITLPAEVRNTLADVLKANQRSRSGSLGHYLLVSDTTDRFLRVYFMDESTRIIAPTILHQDEPGALASITDALRKANFNILTSLSRIYRFGSAHTEFILQPPFNLRRTPDPPTIKQRLEEALSTPELVSRYKTAICYPADYMTPLQARRLSASSSASSDVESTRPSPAEPSTETRLKTLYREFTRRIKQPDATADDRMRFQLVQNLLAEETTTQQTSTRGSLFISSSFKDENLIKRVCESARRSHFEVMIAKELGAAPTTREGIITLMRSCTHFLGIWTEEGGINAQGEWWPSPWLLWELGVADALNLRWRLLISSKVAVEAWKRIAADKPHSIFTSSDFERKLSKVLRILSSER